MASARARPEWRHTIKISNTTSTTASGDKSTDRDDYEPTFLSSFPFFFLSRLKEVQQRRRRQIGFFSREYIYLEASGHGSRSLSVRSRERGRELKAVVRRGTKGVLSWTRSRLVTKCMSGKWPKSWESCCIFWSLEINFKFCTTVDFILFIYIFIFRNFCAYQRRVMFRNCDFHRISYFFFSLSISVPHSLLLTLSLFLPLLPFLIPPPFSYPK